MISCHNRQSHGACNDHDVAGNSAFFKNQTAMEAYQVAPKHLEFVERNKTKWTKVRVFDSVVEGAP